MKTIYEDEWAYELAQRLGFAHCVGRQIVQAVKKSLAAHLEAGDEVLLRGFGRFHCKRVGDRVMKAPNGESIRIIAHRCPAFRPSDPLKKQILTAEARRAPRMDPGCEKQAMKESSASSASLR